MKPGKTNLTLNDSLPTDVANEYALFSKRLNQSLDESLQLDLKDFLQNGLVSDNIEELFKDKNYFRPDKQTNSFEIKFALMTLRYSFIEKFGYVLLNEKLLDTAADFLKNKSVCEIGAGTGWLSYNLQQRGVDITPIDYKPCQDSDFGFKKLHTEVLVTNGLDYLENNTPDVVVLSWPDYDTSFASEILQSLKKGQTLIYVGEGEGGCTGDDHFFELLNTNTKLNENITNSLKDSSLSWCGVHDTWYVYEVQ